MATMVDAGGEFERHIKEAGVSAQIAKKKLGWKMIQDASKIDPSFLKLPAFTIPYFTPNGKRLPGFLRVHVPNAVTLSRIIAGPFLLLALAFQGPTASAVIGFGFLAVSLTDLLDGYLARSWGEVTRIGKLLDPLSITTIISTECM